MKVKRYRMQIMVITTALIIAFILLLFFFIGKKTDSELSGYAQAAVEGASIIMAVIVLSKEIGESKKQEEAEFIVTLNQSFSENADCKKVFYYAICEKRLQDADSGNHPLTDQERKELEKILTKDRYRPNQSELSSYLTFFESILILLDKKAISWEVVNNLFRYRFLIGMHSTFIQEKRLVRLPSNFKNLYYLEYLWMKYNDFTEGLMVGKENCLLNACREKGKLEEYKKIIQEMEKEKGQIRKMDKEHPRNILEDFENCRPFEYKKPEDIQKTL